MTLPERIRRQGRLVFILGFGVVGIGVPASLVLNAVIVALRGDSPSYFSPLNALELMLTLLLVAPLVGGIAGRAIWLAAEQTTTPTAIALNAEDTEMTERTQS